MPQKNLKKAKPAKTAKTNKVRKPAPVMGAVLKKAAKVVAKKVGAVVAKKPVPPAAKKVPAAKAKAPEKKPAAAPVAAPVAVKGKVGNGKKIVAPAPVKEKKAAVPAGKAGKVGGKRGTEVVLEVPAPKGVALLGREGKKKKASAEASLAAKRRCREPGCENDHVLNGYCRLHYIKNWRKIKRKEAILASGQLNNYVEELVSKYPDKYLEVIRQDLASEKDWAKVVTDLELDAGEDEVAGEEDLDAVAEGVRTPSGGNRGDFEDDSEGF